jgi:hypothetical protein
MRKSIIFLTLASLIGCSANQVSKDAAHIEIVYEKPERSKCKFVGEVVGSQGNWFTGDFTSNEALVIGARNTLRNKTYELGGNIVHVQNMSNASAWGALGTTNTTVVGKAYSCIEFNT